MLRCLVRWSRHGVLELAAMESQRSDSDRQGSVVADHLAQPCRRLCRRA